MVQSQLAAEISQAEPVAFNEHPHDRWDAWQDAIAHLRIQDSKTGTAASTQEAFLDVPRGHAAQSTELTHQPL
jgi:hypothetical protein